MSDFIGELRRDLQGRLKEIERQLAGVEHLVAERERLQAVLAAPPFARAERPSPKSPSPKAAKPARKPRAQRGANREAILRVVGERPGVTATEIAGVTKISRAVTYNTLAKLVEQGELAKTELPGGQTGYRVPAGEG